MIGRHRPFASGGAGLLLIATALTGAANYGLSLILVHLLPATEFSRFAAVSTLLLTVGTVAGAAVPWVMAREAALSRRGDIRRRRAIRLGLGASLGLGLVAAVAVAAASASYAGSALLFGETLATVLILLCAVGAGVLQGERSFGALAGVRILEVLVRVALGILAALAGWGSAGVIGAFAAGAGAAALWSLLALGRDLWGALGRAGADDSRAERRVLAKHAAALAGGQAALSLLLTLDVIIGAAVQHGGGLAGYQALLVVARIPLFLATALATAIFPRLVGAASPQSANRAFRSALRVFLLLGGVITAGVATVPPTLIGLLLPAEYNSSLHLLAPLALAGFGGALATLLVAYLQARGQLHAAALVLAGAVVVSVAAYPTAGSDPQLLAWISALVVLSAAAGLAVLVRYVGQSVRVLPTLIRPALATALTWTGLHLLTDRPVLWLGAALVAGTLVLLSVRPRRRPDGPLRVLHLGFEDPARPGAGGGSVRTHEVNRRLAASGVEVVVACSRYPGFTERVQDGVRYIPCGWRLGPLSAGHFPSLLAYFGAVFTGLSRMERRWRPDVIVEDFAAPFSSIAVPYLTRTPVVGVVQWLFAADKARQYHLPFHLVERLGVGSHDALVAVSADLAQELHGRNPHAAVYAVPNGLEPAAWRTPPRTRGNHLLFLGRLEIAQKGMDLLLDAYAAVAPYTGSDLHIAGDGPDEDVLRARAADLGIADRVHWLGRIDGAARFEVLASARLVCMPSRYETFGMVAAESLAVGTPVVAFEIPCLRALVRPNVGVGVPAFDVPAFSAAMLALANDPVRCRRLGAAGPASVRHLDWDAVAAAQLAVYESVQPDSSSVRQTDSPVDPVLVLSTGVEPR
ncbi:glycosyltransferase [Actinoplanes sp. NPDC026619]|uniref:glycosyltransferase n=1 Tax=Actinoplanes sp. NPDC026619 TaxID=3155798 RepID=UPI0033C35B27